MLAQYDYELIYRPGRQMGNADLFSRLPQKVQDFEVLDPLHDVLLIESTPEVPVDSKKIAFLTRKDRVLALVLRWILHGWPSEKPPEVFKPYYDRRDKLSVYNSCILWGSRVIVYCFFEKKFWTYFTVVTLAW